MRWLILRLMACTGFAFLCGAMAEYRNWWGVVGLLCLMPTLWHGTRPG